MIIQVVIVIYLITVLLIIGCLNVGKGEGIDPKERRLKWLMENGYTFEQASKILRNE
jgi:hypothetical protein